MEHVCASLCLQRPTETPHVLAVPCKKDKCSLESFTAPRGPGGAPRSHPHPAPEAPLPGGVLGSHCLSRACD